ncbi:MAG: dCTP deaminase [Deltaproteobacteria bacterium]|nr:dCTP deaminase [Deltaproteobacteria bacterium]
MLSNEDIKKAIEAGELVIDPSPKNLYEAAGVNLHLGANILKPLPGVTVDIKTGALPEYEAYTITADEPYQLDPQEFILGHTYENVTVGAQIGFFIEGRSTLARLGLTVVKTAMLVQPGHTDRTITLELANHGPNPILLYPKMKIAKAAIFRLSSPSTLLYDDRGGKYKDQHSVGRPILRNEFLTED